MYKIRWVGMIGNSGYIEPNEYSNEQQAKNDAEIFNKRYPGITHYVVKVNDD